MKPVKPLVRIVHGSRLYGTSTPTSDQDFKSVHIPSGHNIILQRAERLEGCIDRTIKVSFGIKNTFEDVDDQSYSIQKFFKMVSDGDTVGTEILFANPNNIVDCSDEWNDILKYRHRFLNKNCKGFVGYCKQQAAKYGIKGSRMASVENIISLLSKASEIGNPNNKLASISGLLSVFCEEQEYAEIVNIPSQQSTEVLHLEVVGKKVPYTGTIKQALDLFTKIYDNYGERAKLAKLNEGIDWKALSHAVRVAGQAVELLTTGFIMFPREDAELLLAIKQGKLPYSEVSDILEQGVAAVEEASKHSPLPEQSDYELMDKFVTNFYMDQLSHGYRCNI